MRHLTEVASLRRDFDFGNHFNEWAGFDADYTRCASAEADARVPAGTQLHDILSTHATTLCAAAHCSSGGSADRDCALCSASLTLHSRRNPPQVSVSRPDPRIHRCLPRQGGGGRGEDAGGGGTRAAAGCLSPSSALWFALASAPSLHARFAPCAPGPPHPFSLRPHLCGFSVPAVRSVARAGRPVRVRSRFLPRLPPLLGGLGAHPGEDTGVARSMIAASAAVRARARARADATLRAVSCLCRHGSHQLTLTSSSTTF